MVKLYILNEATPTKERRNHFILKRIRIFEMYGKLANWKYYSNIQMIETFIVILMRLRTNHYNAKYKTQPHHKKLPEQYQNSLRASHRKKRSVRCVHEVITGVHIHVPCLTRTHEGKWSHQEKDYASDGWDLLVYLLENYSYVCLFLECVGGGFKSDPMKLCSGKQKAFPDE